jgi:putative lipoprotein
MAFRSSAAVLAAPLALALLTAPAPAAADPPRPIDPDPWFGRDKALHFGVSAALAGGGYAVSSLAVQGMPERAAIGASVALAAGIAKEMLDLAGLGDPSWKDFTWDVIGTATGIGVSLTVDWAVTAIRKR